MSRSRSASPKRNNETSSAPQNTPEEKPAILDGQCNPGSEMPPLIEFIDGIYDKSVVAMVCWDYWQEPAAIFMKNYCPQYFKAKKWDISALIYFFARNSFFHGLGSNAVQALVNLYCSPTRHSSFQKVIDQILEIHREFEDPKGLRWNLFWLRILRHVNTMTPLLRVEVDENRTAHYIPCYASIFDDEDHYGDCSSELVSIDLDEKEAEKINSRFTTNRKEFSNSIVISDIIDEILWRNWPEMINTGYKFPEIHSCSVAKELRDGLSRYPYWKFNRDLSIDYTDKSFSDLKTTVEENPPSALGSKAEVESNMPPLTTIIKEMCAEGVDKYLDWSCWYEEAVDFFKKFCPEYVKARQWDFAGLVYFYAKKSYLRGSGSFEVQALLDSFCTCATWNFSFQTVLDRILFIHQKIPEAERPSGLRWALFWQRVLRHVNQRSPLLYVFPCSDGSVAYYPRYYEIFSEGDKYGNYTSELANISFTAKDIHEINSQWRSKYNRSQACNGIVISKIAEEILWRNWLQLVNTGYRLPFAEQLKEQLSAYPGWKFKADNSIDYKLSISEIFTV